MEEKHRGMGEGGWDRTRTAIEAVAVTCERAISGYARRRWTMYAPLVLRMAWKPFPSSQSICCTKEGDPFSYSARSTARGCASSISGRVGSTVESRNS